MSKKVLFFLIYTSIIVLLITLPINYKESALNNTYILSIRGDYFGHAVLFLPWMWLKPNKSFNPGKGLWLLTGLVFANLSEFIQYLLPYRSFNINDIVANNTGILLSGILYKLFVKQ